MLVLCEPWETIYSALEEKIEELWSLQCDKTPDPLLSKAGFNPRLLASNSLKSEVTSSGCESRSPGRGDAVQNPCEVAA
jgi:hypothetical protein